MSKNVALFHSTIGEIPTLGESNPSGRSEAAPKRGWSSKARSGCRGAGLRTECGPVVGTLDFCHAVGLEPPP